MNTPGAGPSSSSGASKTSKFKLDPMSLLLPHERAAIQSSNPSSSSSKQPAASVPAAAKPTHSKDPGTFVGGFRVPAPPSTSQPIPALQQPTRELDDSPLPALLLRIVLRSSLG